MRTFKLIAIWILISFAIQFSGFFYMNKYYLNAQSKVKVTKIVKNTKQSEKRVSIPVDDDVSSVKSSYSGKYVAYKEGNTIKVANTETGDIKSVESEDDSKLSYYRWWPDRNRMIIAEKEDSHKGSCIKFYYYDASKDQKDALNEAIHKKITSIPLDNDKLDVKDIALSTVSGVTYVKLSSSGRRSIIYKFDIMFEMTKVKNIGGTIGKIAVAQIDDPMFYEDTTYRKIRNSLGQTVDVSGVSNPCLLSIDSNDNIYIGELQGSKVSKIFSRNINDKSGSWNTKDLKSAVEREDIYACPNNGKLFINDNLKGIVTQLDTGKQTKYKGIFEGIYDKGIVCISDGKLIEIPLN